LGLTLRTCCGCFLIIYHHFRNLRVNGDVKPFLTSVYTSFIERELVISMVPKSIVCHFLPPDSLLKPL
jgi:hypothetical protein